MKARISLTLALLMFVGACAFDDPLDGFSGTMETPQGKIYAVAHFDQFRLPRYKGRMNITIHPVLGDAIGENLQVNFNWFKKTMILDYPKLSPLPVTLSVTSTDEERTCGDGIAHGNKITFCYGWGDLALHMTSPSKNTILHLDLKRGVDFQYTLSPTISLNEALGRARFSDYRVRQYAERVYRAREQIQNDKSKLYPRFSARTIVGIALSASMGAVTGFVIFDIADNFLPFVYPSNWFQVDVSQKNFEAEIAAFESLQANQMLAAQTLFYSIEKDYQILNHIESRLTHLRELQAIISQRNLLGETSDAQLSEIDDRVVKSELDIADFNAKVLRQELATFARALAIRPFQGEPPALVKEDSQRVDQFEKISENEMNRDLERARQVSFELRTLRHLKEAANQQIKVTSWGFLAPGSGILIDAGYMSRNRISTSSAHEVQIKLNETEASLEESLTQVVHQYNSNLDDYFYWKSQHLNEQREIDRFHQFSQWNPNRLIEQNTLYDRLLQTEVSTLETKTALLINQAAYQRLVLAGRFAILSD